jgi:hypothetical protein
MVETVRTDAHRAADKRRAGKVVLAKITIDKELYPDRAKKVEKLKELKILTKCFNQFIDELVIPEIKDDCI